MAEYNAVSTLDKQKNLRTIKAKNLKEKYLESNELKKLSDNMIAATQILFL